MDFIMTQALHDIDVVLAKEHGIPANAGPGESIEEEGNDIVEGDESE
jgi:hypothetical protein